MKWPGAMFTCIKQLVCCFRPLAEIQNSSIIWHILQLIYLILGKTQHFSVPFTGFNTRIEPIQVSCRVKWSMQAVFWIHKLLGLPDPDPVSQRYGSGIGSGSFCNQQKIVNKPVILLFCDFFMTFYLWCKCNGHWWKAESICHQKVTDPEHWCSSHRQLIYWESLRAMHKQYVHTLPKPRWEMVEISLI
jgi:hypothetical protein